MVSVKQLEGEYTFVKSNASSEQSKCHQMTPRGVETHLYQFGSPAKGNGSYDRIPYTAEEGQNLLDSLLLSQWEECSWKGQLMYDVTMCETKVICGGMKLIAQLNENWDSNFLTEFENSDLPPFGPFKPSYMRTLREKLLFCVANGQKENSELIPSTMLPKDGILIIINVNPVEYGHIFLVPYDMRQTSQFLDKKMLHLAAQFTAEINSCSFRLFFDHTDSTRSDHVYFQAGYFANPLPVELLPTVPVYNSVDNEGVHICEVADYPLKALLFTSQNLGTLVAVVAEICSSLQQAENTLFNLLVSDCGTKMFMFPQVTGSHLSTWECGGYFICNTRSEFDDASEVELSKRMASVSLDERSFQALKQLCCSIAVKNAL